MQEDWHQILISVIIPYSQGHENNLDKTLTALHNQTCPPDEIIIVSDGSDDGRDVLKLIQSWGILRNNCLNDIKYIWTRKTIVGKDTVPRNKGARLAKNKHLVFIDCDILLEKTCLEEYAKSFIEHPNCIILGKYDWLPPMEFGEEEIRNKFKTIENLGCPQLECDGTHNVMKDIRNVSFDEFDKHKKVFDNMAAGLACFGGNLGLPFDTYWKLGGFNDRFTPGLVDDGPFGLNAVLHKVEIVFNKDIMGLHQYHSRNTQYVIEQSKKEVPLIDKTYGLNGNSPDPLKQKPVYQLTEEIYKHWGLNPPDWINELKEAK